MKLPNDKKRIRVVFIYEDGSEYYIDGRELKKWEENMDTAGVYAWTHGVKYHSLIWKDFDLHPKKYPKLKLSDL